MEDRKCRNFIGSQSCLENLALIKGKGKLFQNTLKKSDQALIFKDLDGILSEAFIEKIREMIYTRYKKLHEIL